MNLHILRALGVYGRKDLFGDTVVVLWHEYVALRAHKADRRRHNSAHKENYVFYEPGIMNIKYIP